MNLSIDFGGSTIDVIWWNESLPQRIRSFERSSVFADHDLEQFFRRAKVSLTDVGKIFVTGGRSRFFPKKFQSIVLEKVSEIEAIGKGGHYLLHNDKKLKPFWNEQKILVVSMGTGTCMVEMRQKNGKYLSSQHVGGTGVGGGTFLGLSKALLGEVDPKSLQKLFRSGDVKKVDLSVNDIIGSGIGIVPPEATASHLAKISREIDFSKADLGAGIVNFIGQTIGIVAVFAAKAQGCSALLLAGKLTRMNQITDVILRTAKIYHLPVLLPQNAAYVAAFGSGMK